MIENSKIHSSVKIWHPEHVNIYNSEIGEGTTIGCFVEIGGSKIGKNCAIGAYVFIPPGTEVGDNVFLGPKTTICNDRYPIANNKDWKLLGAIINNGASIGAGVILLPGVVIGEKSMIGAGAVIVKDVPPNTVVVGNPGRKLYDK
jgi:UDP-2-acetamido-3-amino-2,3-dideoxy-glucuronate N-acetyltransferase